MAGGYALFRLPGETRYTSVKSSRVERMSSPEEIGGVPGFVIAPFAADSATPLLFLPAERFSVNAIPDSTMRSLSASPAFSRPLAAEAPTSSYADSFGRFHSEVLSGRFAKLVLSRSRRIGLAPGTDLREMFLDCCSLYPNLMVMLFSAPECGTWLVATPEPLLEWCAGECHTVALAGTMKIAEGGWSEKNKDEQKVVESFLTGALSEFRVRTRGPFSSPAGELLHLRTDIYFPASRDVVGKVVARIHPTPAVCGLPQENARKFILENELYPRRYYSGFAGPVLMEGSTALYVSLRCAELDPAGNSATLYAGGGIMPESDCASEFEETERKMMTIAKCIVSRKM